MISVLFLCLTLVDILQTEDICTHPSYLGGHKTGTKHVPAEGARRRFAGEEEDEGDEEGTFTSTGHKTSLGLQEIACYRYTEPGVVSQEGRNIVVMIKLVKMEEIYPIVEKYNFSIPRVDTECWCDCPGGMDYCNSGMHECKEPCVSWFQPDQTTKGCSITLGRSQLCCTAELEVWRGAGQYVPRNDSTLTAIKLGKPSLVATVSQKRYLLRAGSTEKELLGEDVRRVKLEKHHVLHETLRMVLHLESGSDAHHVLENNWYFMVPGIPNDNVKLYTGSDINGLDEWDVKKLGWFRPNGTSFEFDEARLASEISGEVRNCGDQKLEDFQFGTMYVDGFPSDYSEDLNVELEKVGKYTVQENSVVLNKVKVSERVEVSMTLTDIPEDVTKIYHDTNKFSDFSPSILIRENQVYLIVELYGAEGTLEGKYYSDNNIESGESRGFTLHIPSGVDYIEKEVILIEPCSELTAQVCLRPWSHDRPGEFRCRTAYCEEETVRDLSGPTVLESHHPVKLKSWHRLFSPGEWFNGIGSTLELVLMLTVLLFVVFFIVSLLKLGLRLMGER